MTELPRSPIKRLLKQGGADRVSEDAVEYIAQHLDDLVKEMGATAAQAAQHGNRKTVQREDASWAWESELHR